MINTMSVYDFREWFANSSERKNQFTYDGLTALFEYLEEYEESTGEQIEFDPIALCVEYTEYDSLKKLQDNYSDIKNIEQLRDNTTVIEFGDGQLIVEDF